MSRGKGAALVLTVGTGDVENREATLFAPLRKSIRKGEWSRVLLLPSAATKDLAEALRDELKELPVEARPLPVEGAQNDADVCFAHFDEVLRELRLEYPGPGDIVVDFTRGTKAMSAALVLAAVRHDVAKLRYITGHRDARGAVVPGTEEVSEVRTALALGRKALDLARRFLEEGDFAAVLRLVPDSSDPYAALGPPALREVSRAVRPMAEFYGAWDRLDYRTAAKVVVPDLPRSGAEWSRFTPSSQARRWVEILSNPFPDKFPDKARRAWYLALDLLANGERRLRQRQYEDALLRAYRILEIAGQSRLFLRGLDQDRMPASHPDVQRALRQHVGLRQVRSAAYEAGRHSTAHMLRILGDPLGFRLLSLGRKDQLPPSARNDSLLSHGFRCTSGSNSRSLAELYAKLEELLLSDGDPKTREWLAVARSMNFGRS